MAASMRPSLLPWCSSCTRRFAASTLEGWRPLQQQHVRGKKKMVDHSDTMVVQLLKNVKGYGKKGSYVPVPRGMGRNRWIPMQLAQYVTLSQLKQLRTDNVPIERDFEFGLGAPDQDVKASTVKSIASTIMPAVKSTIKVEGLASERKAELITIFLPSTLTFQRPVVAQGSNAIFGSVTTQDIANHVRESLAHNPEASRVLVTDFDVRFVIPESKATPVEGEVDTEERLKHLGVYEVSISVKGLDDAITRRVKIVESADAKEQSV